MGVVLTREIPWDSGGRRQVATFRPDGAIDVYTQLVAPVGFPASCTTVGTLTLYACSPGIRLAVATALVIQYSSANNAPTFCLSHAGVACDHYELEWAPATLSNDYQPPPIVRVSVCTSSQSRVHDSVRQARRAVAVSYDASGLWAGPFSSIYVGTSGDLRIQCAGSSTPVTLKNCPVGFIDAVEVAYVYSSGTTATDLVGFLE